MADSAFAQLISTTHPAETTPQDQGGWKVDDLIIDRAARTVHRGAKPLRVTGLSFDLLVTLIKASPGAVDQDTLIDRVWKGRVVSPETVSQRIKLLRDALGDEAADPRYIGLVWGRGYKLLPAVQRLEATGSETAARWRPRSVLVGSIGITALFLAAALFLWAPAQPTPPVTAVRPGIAVLPFSAQGQGMEGQEAEFLAAGIHDDIITALAQIKDLLVISRTSVLAYRDKQLPVPEIGKSLNVDKILEGQVQRTTDKIKLNVQLIDATTDKHLWAKSYEKDLSVADVLAVQQQIAADVAATFKMSLAESAGRSATPTESLPAYDHYLAARQSFQRAEDQFSRGPDLFSGGMQSLTTAATELSAALTEDPEFAEAHALLSMVQNRRYAFGLEKTQGQRDQVAASLLKAMELDPDNPRVNQALGQYYFLIGKFDESLKQAERVVDQLPQETGLLVALGMRYFIEGQVDKARQMLERAVAQDPLYFPALRGLVDVKNMSGDQEGALALNRRARALRPDDVSLAYQEANIRFFASGDLDAHRKAIARLPIIDIPSALAHWNVAFMARDYAKALSALKARPFKEIVTFIEFTPYTYYTGLTHLMAGDREQAADELQRARQALEAVASADNPEPRVLSRLAEVLAALGERELARQAVRQTLESDLFNNIELLAWIWNANLLHALTLNGDIADALDLLESKHSLFGREFWHVCAYDPILGPLRAQPRYQELSRDSAKPPRELL